MTFCHMYLVVAARPRQFSSRTKEMTSTRCAAGFRCSAFFVWFARILPGCAAVGATDVVGPHGCGGWKPCHGNHGSHWGWPGDGCPTRGHGFTPHGMLCKGSSSTKCTMTKMRYERRCLLALLGPVQTLWPRRWSWNSLVKQIEVFADKGGSFNEGCR